MDEAYIIEVLGKNDERAEVGQYANFVDAVKYGTEFTRKFGTPTHVGKILLGKIVEDEKTVPEIFAP